jgi:hypothetical protein
LIKVPSTVDGTLVAYQLEALYPTIDKLSPEAATSFAEIIRQLPVSFTSLPELKAGEFEFPAEHAGAANIINKLIAIKGVK